MGQVTFQTKQANAEGEWLRTDGKMFTNYAIVTTMALLNTGTLDATNNDMTVLFDITDAANESNGLSMTQTSMDSIMQFVGKDD